MFVGRGSSLTMFIAMSANNFLNISALDLASNEILPYFPRHILALPSFLDGSPNCFNVFQSSFELPMFSVTF